MLFLKRRKGGKGGQQHNKERFCILEVESGGGEFGGAMNIPTEVLEADGGLRGI